MTYKSLKANLIGLFYRLSYREGDFRLSNRHRLDYFIDCMPTLLSSFGSYLVGSIFCNMLGYSGVKIVSGMGRVSRHILGATIAVSYMESTQLTGLMITSAQTRQKTDIHIDGLSEVKTGTKVAIVQDVVIRGKTLLNVYEILTDRGFDVVACLALFDYEFGAWEKSFKRGCTLQAVFTHQDMVAYKASLDA